MMYSLQKPEKTTEKLHTYSATGTGCSYVISGVKNGVRSIKSQRMLPISHYVSKGMLQ